MMSLSISEKNIIKSDRNGSDEHEFNQPLKENFGMLYLEKLISDYYII